jgi:2',3'-cyclic-nucleotide 2'-phosphodiesterase/3'-nucleotidase
LVGYVVTTNDRADGGGGFPGLARAEVVPRAPDANRDTVLRDLTEEPGLPVDPVPAWRFAPLGGVTVTFARRPLAGRPDVRWLEAAEGGWDRFAMTL